MAQTWASRNSRALSDPGRIPGAAQLELVQTGRGHGLPEQARGAWEDMGRSGDGQEAESKEGQDTSLRLGCRETEMQS